MRHRWSMLVTMVLAAALAVPVSSSGQTERIQFVRVTGILNNAGPPGATYAVDIACVSPNWQDDVFPDAAYTDLFTVTFTFANTAGGYPRQEFRNFRPNREPCRPVRAYAPGYPPESLGIDYAQPYIVYYTWRTAPSTQPGSTTTTPTTRPPAPARPAVEVAGVDFGSQLAGVATAPRDAIVRNRGQVAFTVARFETAEPFAIIGGTCQQGAVQPGGECTLQVTARPPNAAAYERPLVVEVGAATGTGRAQAALRVQGSDVENFSVGGASFGTVNVGTVSGVQTIPVVNVGSLAARISKIAVTGPFQIAPGGSCEVNTTTLAPRAQCTVNVVFAPTANGAQNGTLEITAISPSKDIISSGALNGTGVLLVGQLQVTPPVVDFGRLRVGATSPKQQVTVSNVGSAPVTVTGVGFPVAVPANRRKKTPATTRLVPATAGFTSVNGCRRALAPGASCVVTVTAKPGSRKELTAQLQVVAAGAQGASQLTVVGFARSIAATPAAVVLPPTPIGTPSAPSAPVVVTNTGDEPVVVSGVTLGGPQRAELAIVSSDCPKAALAPKARCTFVVRATPAGGGARSGTVVVVTETKEQATVGARWSAQVGALALNPPLLDFGTLDVGRASPPQQAEVRNVGKVPVIVTRLDRSDAAVTLVQGCVGTRLEPGQACGFTVAVRPRRVGPLTGGVAVTGSSGEKAGQRLRYVVRGAATTAPAPTVAPTIPISPTTAAPVTQPPVAVVPPALVMRPASGEIGQPTTAIGTGFPANADVTLMWPNGVTAGTARTDDTGSFAKVVLPLPGLRLGPTTVTGSPVAGGAGAEAPYLLQYATFRPQGRNRAIVTRG